MKRQSVWERATPRQRRIWESKDRQAAIEKMRKLQHNGAFGTRVFVQ